MQEGTGIAVNPRARRGGAIEAQRARAEETRLVLLQTARAMFAKHGFHGARTDALAPEAHVTEGSIYHHFKNKRGLFEAVFREVISQARAQANLKAIDAGEDTWTRTLVAFETYILLIGASQEFQRIVLIDGPVVFGWPHWNELQSEYVAGPVLEALTQLMDGGIITRAPAARLASMLQSALNDAAMAI